MITTQQKPIIHKCAWCQRLIIDGIRIDSTDIAVETVDSHGICLICAAEVEALYCRDIDVSNDI